MVFRKSPDAGTRAHKREQHVIMVCAALTQRLVGDVGVQNGNGERSV
jgi:hypothetical protein